MRAATIITAVGLSLSALALTALAQQEAAPQGPESVKPVSFQEALGNKNANKKKGGPRAEGRFFERMDANNDGLVSEEEVQAFKDQREQDRETRQAERATKMASKALENFDANADGVLDAGELEAMFASRPGPGARGKEGARGQGKGKRAGKDGPGRAMRMLGQEGLAQFDTDNDGKVSREEASAQREQIRAALEAKKGELQSRFDLDGDGELSDAARKPLRTTVGAERRVKRADLDQNGVLDTDELRAALTRIDDQDPRADFNGDGDVNKDDYETLLKAMPGV